MLLLWLFGVVLVVLALSTSEFSEEASNREKAKDPFLINRKSNHADLEEWKEKAEEVCGDDEYFRMIKSLQ